MSSERPDQVSSPGDTTPANAASATGRGRPSPVVLVTVAIASTVGAAVVAMAAGSEESGVRIAASSTTPESTTPVEPAPPPAPPPAVTPPSSRPAPAPRVRGRVGSARPAAPRVLDPGSLLPSAEAVAGWSAAAPTPSGDVRVVARGESLWSIASELAGKSASARRVAAVTGDLWTLNAKVIGTGSPHTVFVGARLRLPETP